MRHGSGSAADDVGVARDADDVGVARVCWRILGAMQPSGRAPQTAECVA